MHWAVSYSSISNGFTEKQGNGLYKNLSAIYTSNWWTRKKIHQLHQY